MTAWLPFWLTFWPNVYNDSVSGTVAVVGATDEFWLVEHRVLTEHPTGVVVVSGTLVESSYWDHPSGRVGITGSVVRSSIYYDIAFGFIGVSGHATDQYIGPPPVPRPNLPTFLSLDPHDKVLALDG